MQAFQRHAPAARCMRVETSLTECARILESDSRLSISSLDPRTSGGGALCSEHQRAPNGFMRDFALSLVPATVLTNSHQICRSGERMRDPEDHVIQFGEVTV